MDVVPVFEEFWTHPPFSANIDESGRIYARGAQDMKSIGTQYLAAIRALKRDRIEQFKRTIHVIFVPDEEINGIYGMEGFVSSKEFIDLNVGFSLDEGDPSPTDELIVYHGERSSCGKPLPPLLILLSTISNCHEFSRINQLWNSYAMVNPDMVHCS